MTYYIIPVFSYMEPFDGANERLLEHTLDGIPKKFHRRVVVTTDQDEAIERVKDTRIKGIRSDVQPPFDHSEAVEGSLKKVLLDVKNKMNMHPDDDFVTLSIEYPDRSYPDIRSAIQRYRQSDSAKSLLCRRPTSCKPPYLMIETPNGRNLPVVENAGQEWREDRFRTAFKHSYFVTIQNVDEIDNLSDWLWNPQTIFFPIGKDTTRIRTEEELNEYEG